MNLRELVGPSCTRFRRITSRPQRCGRRDTAQRSKFCARRSYLIAEFSRRRVPLKGQHKSALALKSSAAPVWYTELSFGAVSRTSNRVLAAKRRPRGSRWSRGVDRAQSPEIIRRGHTKGLAASESSSRSSQTHASVVRRANAINVEFAGETSKPRSTVTQLLKRVHVGTLDDANHIRALARDRNRLSSHSARTVIAQKSERAGKHPHLTAEEVLNGPATHPAGD